MGAGQAFNTIYPRIRRLYLLAVRAVKPEQLSVQKILLKDTICTRTMVELSGGVFVVAMALALGASNFVIGLLVAIGPACQILQIPAIYLVDSIRSRKSISLGFAFAARALLLVIAYIPFYFADAIQLSSFLVCLCLHFALSAVSGCAFSSWVRDIIDDKTAGSFLGRNLSIATGISAVAICVFFFIRWGRCVLV